ncbi:fibrillin-3 [Biomphalaria pfeifferi]|uniref:Fibrillin-3 n=1 Tax=Biomphalaria pfeifferi TaxID=112525 RepID=A0AAD8FL32_BIOPF|nr:fibrillin-3 [Biomphalaria pfeifferi]
MLCIITGTVGFDSQLRINATWEYTLNDTNSITYIELSKGLKKSLMELLSRTISQLIDIIINGFREGSIIVDFTTLVASSASATAGSQLVEALISIVKNGINVNGTYYGANVTVGGLNVTANTSKCDILNALQACKSNTTCTINSDGQATCNEDSSDAVNVPLIIGLCVGMPLALLCIVVLVLLIEYRKKYLEQRRINARESDYTDRPSTPKDGFSGSRPSSGKHLLPMSKEKLLN